ncbi:MAG: hypothetical protein ABJF04_23060 [Reichenbachiella sp.]|uniref:hypothetical protein n=1 Tax=Reichenbachiella sp. TaxID=2184521 RepID=UPI00326666D2
MKFLQTHRKDLLLIMADLGYSAEHFEYVKRKGRIHIVDNEAERSFSYFRRKATQLHPETKQWVESETFEVSIDGDKPIVVNLWEEVCDAFKVWLGPL